MDIMQRIRNMFMRLFTITLLATLTILSSAPAQKINELNFLFSGGYSMPRHNDFTKIMRGGLAIGAGLSYRLSSNIFILTNVDVNSFTVNMAGRRHEDGISRLFDVDAGPANIMSVTGNMKYLLLHSNYTDRDPFAIYVVGGIGVSQVSIPRITETMITNSTIVSETMMPTDDTAFNASIGWGIEFPGGGLPGVFVEARYAVGFTKGQNTYYIPLRMGFRGDF